MCPAPVDVAAETVIFVDVDGVLNVGVRDQGDSPLLYNEHNQSYAKQHQQQQQEQEQGQQQRRRQLRPEELDCVQKLLAVGDRAVAGGKGTYAELACPPGTHVCEALARNLASVITAAGDRCSVVLSSNWRRPQHAARVKLLEAKVSRLLGRDWSFTAKTRPADERGAADRLRCIGDFVEGLCVNGRCRDGRPLRLLVLEDFFITPLDGWVCGGSSIESAAAVEAYLRQRAKRETVSVKLIHTYDEWTTDDGLHVQVGSGLTEAHTQQALDFLAAPALRCLERLVQEDVAKGKLAVVAAAPSLNKVAAAAGAGPAEARLAEHIGAVLPWLTMYLPCTV